MSDMILSLHFVYSPAILLYIINNIMLLKRSIIAKSTVCADIFNNMLHRPLYSLLRTKGVESKEHLLRIRVQAYSMIICLRSLLCNTTTLRMWIGLFSTCNVSAYAGLTSFSRSLHMDISFDGILHFALLTLSSSSIFQTPYRLLSAKLISHFLNFHLISR